jgi:phage baseplate assembly protein gpV
MKRSLAEAIKGLEVKPRIEGVRVGTIVEVDENGRVLVDFPGNPEGPVVARFTSAFGLRRLKRAAANGERVLLACENNDPGLPIVIDSVCNDAKQVTTSEAIALQTEDLDEILVDGKRVTFDATEEIVLRCGKASITLTRAGKVLIRGAYLSSHSSGVNRIKGGSVQIN